MSRVVSGVTPLKSITHTCSIYSLKLDLSKTHLSVVLLIIDNISLAIRSIHLLMYSISFID